MSDQPSGQRVLVVEDESNIASFVAMYLKKAGFGVIVVRNGEEALARANSESPAIVLLDLNLPDADGIDVCRELRKSSDVPILMLTARDDDVDEIIGLEVGADDYMAKPFNPRELAARIKAVLRRSTNPAATEPSEVRANKLVFGEFELDPATRTLKRHSGEILLTAGEYDLLIAFVDHPRRVLNRDQLLDMARGRAAIPFDRSIDVQVGRLRRKIENDPKCPNLIKTVRGGGYMFTAEVNQA